MYANIKAQHKEIMEMQRLIKCIEENGIVETEADKENRSIPKFEGTTEKETLNLNE